MHWLLRSGATAGPLQLSQNRKKETRFSSKSTISQAPPAPHPIPPDPYSTTPRHQPTYLQNPNQHPSVPNQPDPPAEMTADPQPTTRSNYIQPNHQQSLLSPGRPPITPLNPSQAPPFHCSPLGKHPFSYKNQTNHPPWPYSPLGQHPPPATHPSPTIKPGDAHHAATTSQVQLPPRRVLHRSSLLRPRGSISFIEAD